jgi:selenophosphate synthetase-related protein
MKAAASAYNVPIVGGHTNCHSPYNALSVAILGRATHLITSFNTRPGDILLVVIDFQGEFYHRFPFWNAATTADPVQLQKKLEILPYLSEAGLCDAGKDISMGGIVGTLLMLLETSNCGAVLNLDAIAPPDNIPLEQWLLSFPSYGFLLSVRPEKVASVQACFHEQNLVCSAVGTVEEHHQLVLKLGNESAVFWDISTRSLMGFSAEGKR